jgi:hypothetical protein
MANIAYDTFKNAAATHGEEDLIAVIKAIK